MKLKTVVSIVLLLFVAASIVALIVKQSGDSSATSPGAGAGVEATEAGSLSDGVIVYYFHGNMRCPTCNTLEAYSKEAVETLFADELNSGQVELQVVNYDESWNEHYLTDYDLSFQSLVLVEIKDGREVSYKNLDEIWDLVGNKQAYFEYVRSETNALLTAE